MHGLDSLKNNSNKIKERLDFLVREYHLNPRADYVSVEKEIWDLSQRYLELTNQVYFWNKKEYEFR